MEEGHHDRLNPRHATEQEYYPEPGKFVSTVCALDLVIHQVVNNRDHDVYTTQTIDHIVEYSKRQKGPHSRRKECLSGQLFL